MSPSIFLKYRPVKIGWVIGKKDIALASKASCYSSCLWGGRFNPIIPAYNPGLAHELIKVFAVDILHPLDDGDETRQILQQYESTLIQGIFKDEVFNAEEQFCHYADIYHPAKRFQKEKIDDVSLTCVDWDNSDPLDKLFTLTFGRYPNVDETGFDYSLIYKELSPENHVISVDEALPSSLLNYISPINFTSFFLARYGVSNPWLSPGIFIGDSSKLDDLIKFWNLRAAGAGLLFYDPLYHKRLSPLIEEHASFIREDANNPEKHYKIWSGDTDTSIDALNLDGLNIRRCHSDHVWNGFNTVPVKTYFHDDDHDVISSYSEYNQEQALTFSLPEKPFFPEASHAHMQKFVVSVRCLSFKLDEKFTFNTPYIPMLNEFYGRNMYGIYDGVRSEMDFMGEHTLGIITAITSQRATISAISAQKFWAEFFRLVGLEYKGNEPGYRCANLIKQLGGLQGCRVLKIPGLRKLIHKYSQDQSFTQAAKMIILDKDDKSGISTFKQHEHLYIEQRSIGTKLTSQDVFTYMVKNGLFRVGLEFKCTNCFLESWIHLDDVKTICKCEYCGNEFNVTPFLKDRDWRYRRSGVLGLPKDKLDSIAVALTLQQLDALFRESIMYSTSANLDSKNSKVKACEVDFLLMLKGSTHLQETPIQLLIGECKSDGGIIDEEDVQKMGELASELEEKLGQAFVMFSKTGPFSEGEINLINTLNDEHKLRAIIWSPDQLEPYRPYERADQSKLPKPHPRSLSDLALNTRALYFK